MRKAPCLRVFTTSACLLAVAAALLIGDAPAARGQSNSLLGESALGRFGLEPMWATRIQVDRSRGRVLNVLPYVSTRKALTIFEVTHEFGKTIISELQLDQFRQPLGVEGAREHAKTMVAEIKNLYPGAKTEPVITERVIPNLTLYVTTELGTVQSIDAETGRVRWTTTVGRYDFPTTEAAANEQYVALINGLTMFVLKASDGTLVWERKMTNTPTAGPALSDEYIFAPTSRGLIESYTLGDSKAPAWTYKGAGRALVQPISANETLAWPTDVGHVYVASTNPRAMRYRVESGQIFSAPPAILGSRLFATSADGYVSCMNLQSEQNDSRRVLWKYSLGEPSRITPVAVKEDLFVISDYDHMFCLDVQTGNERWRTAGVRQFLAATATRLYAVGDIGRLVILDIKTGSRLAEIPTEELDLRVINPLTDRIYLGTRSGSLQCLREIGTKWPTVHTMAVEAKKPRPKIKQGGPAGDNAPKANDDPFGAPGGADPKPMKMEDDPFAAPMEKKMEKKPDNDPFG